MYICVYMYVCILKRPLFGIHVYMLVYIPLYPCTHTATWFYTQHVAIWITPPLFCLFVETDSHYVAQAGLRLLIQIRLALNLQSSFLVLPSTGITAMCRHDSGIKHTDTMNICTIRETLRYSDQ